MQSNQLLDWGRLWEVDGMNDYRTFISNILQFGTTCYWGFHIANFTLMLIG